MTLKKTGFTLIETLVVVSVLGLVLIAAMSIFVSMNQIRAKAKALTKIREIGSSAIQYISKNVRNAISISEEDDNIYITDSTGEEYQISCSSGALQFGSRGSPQNLITDGLVTLSDCVLTLAPADSSQPAVLEIRFVLSMADMVESGEEFRTKIVIRNTKSD